MSVDHQHRREDERVSGWTDIGWTTNGATCHDPQPGDDERIMWVFRSKGLRTRLLAESATAARELIALRDAALQHHKPSERQP